MSVKKKIKQKTKNKQKFGQGHLFNARSFLAKKKGLQQYLLCFPKEDIPLYTVSALIPSIALVEQLGSYRQN